MNKIYNKEAQHLIEVAHATLRANVTVQDILGNPPRLYDCPPENPTYPYLIFGHVRSSEIAHIFSLHFHSQLTKKKEIINLVNTIADVFETTALDVVFADVFRAPNGRSFHGIIRLCALTNSLINGLRMQ